MIRLASGTVQARFTLLYAAVFLVSGIGLLGLTFLLSGGSVSNVAPAGNPPPGAAARPPRSSVSGSWRTSWPPCTPSRPANCWPARWWR
ncbi:hypothetical protein [Plantactinospora veratri]